MEKMKMEKKMVLAVGNSGSYEVEAYQVVRQELKREGVEMILFCQDKCLESQYLTFSTQGGDLKVELDINGRVYNVSDFSSIYYLHPHLPRELLEFEPPEYRHFIHRQFEESRRILWSIFRHKIWINDPWHMVIAENKAYQAMIAKEVGLILPDTLITSNPDRVRSFHKRNRSGSVVKLLATSPILDHVIYTNELDDDGLREIDALRSSPSIFQEKVEKSYELRITIAGNNVFPAKILSQQDTSTALDWRRKPVINDYEVKIEPANIDPYLEKKLVMFLKRLSLRFGCIDMIVTPSGEYVFLEVNPNGQWYFVQLKTKAAIAKSIAELLITPATA